MVLKEFQKIWNVRTMLLVFIVGGTLFYSWVMGQMNLKHLPLFETVDVEVGTELLKQYGTGLDASEIAEIQILYEQAEEKLNEVALAAYPEIRDMGFESYREFEHYCTTYVGEEGDYEEYIQTEEYKALNSLYEKMVDDLAVGWELETCNAYDSILANIAISRYGYTDLSHNKELGNGLFLKPLLSRLKTIVSRDTVTTLPGSVEMNMGYIMQSYSRIVFIVTLLLVLPYVAMENRNGVYPIAAATKTGRRLMLHQIKAMLVAVVLLLLVFNLVFYLVYLFYTPYARFAQCMVPDLWFDFTWSQYLWIRIWMLDLWAIAHSMIIFFLASFCKTIVGTVVVALPCWGVGEFAGVCIFTDLLTVSYKEPEFYSIVFGDKKYMPFVAEVLLLAIGIWLLWSLYQRRKREDIVE